MSSAGRWKTVAVFLGLCCLALSYRIVDQGITRTYLDLDRETSVRHIRLLTGLVEHEWAGLPEQQAMERLSAYVASNTREQIVLKRGPESNTIYLEGVRFEFRDGKLARVQ